MLSRLSSRDTKLLGILNKLKVLDLICEKPYLGIRDYTTKEPVIYLEYKGTEIVGMIAWHLEKVPSPGESSEELIMDVIVIDTLCYKDDSVRKTLMSTVPVIHYPTGRSPGMPSGFTSSYNNEAEGDPKLLELPAASAPKSIMGGVKWTPPPISLSNNNSNNNSNNYTNSNSNYENSSQSRATNFTKKTEGPSAFFPKVTVKTRHRRRSRRNRRLSMRRRRA